MLFIILIAVIAIGLKLYFRKIYSRFSEYGVKHFEPTIFFGNMVRSLFRIDIVTEDMERTYNSFPNERFVGKYEFACPNIIIKDIELAKQIAVKDFEHFLDHRTLMDEKTEPLFGRNLFSLKGQEWKDMRSTLSPAFTSSKMRFMMPFIVEVGNQMIEVLKKKISESGNGYIDIEAKDLSTRFANDVIATCAFGLQVNSHTEENNEFYLKGKEVSTFTFLQLLKVIGYIAVPGIMNALKIRLAKEENTSYFKNVVQYAMKSREEKNIIRPDMIHLLMEAKKGTLSHDKNVDAADTGFATVQESSVGKREISRAWSDDDLTAQAILFFIAGFDTVSTTMAFALHELTVNPDMQNRLVEEIREHHNKSGGKLEYDSIQKLVYMDMVVSETLRLWPPGVAIDRMCVKDYNLGRPNSTATKDYVIRKGEGITIPAWSIHRDPNYYPDPLKFDPERFSEENKHKIHPYTYVPFGLGPRNYIGSRFALCEVKVMIYQLLLHMELSVCEKTCIPAELARNSVNIRLKGGHWMRAKIRS